MNHPLTLHALAKIHQADLANEAGMNRLLRETRAARPWPIRQWLMTVLLMAAGAGVLFLLAG